MRWLVLACSAGLLRGELDGHALLQSRAVASVLNEAGAEHPELLAQVSGVERMIWKPRNESYELLFFSAVPVFGAGGHYVALLHDIWTAENPSDFLVHAKDSPLYCSGPNRSHLTRMRVKGWEHETQTTLNFLCDWPPEDAELRHYEIFLEDAHGDVLGSLKVQRRPLRQTYHTAICVRDLFRESEQAFNDPYKLLPEWLEFHTMHGVDHFFMYSFGEPDHILNAIMKPYVDKGLASQIHFDQYPERRIRHHRAMADCLYRSKEHAKWLLPTLDIDEFFHFRKADVFNRTIPLDYFKTGWDAILSHAGKRFQDVHSILFELHRFKRSSEKLQISSLMRQDCNNKPFPKYVVNVMNVHGLWVHWPTSWTENTTGLRIPKPLAVANHYRSAPHVPSGEALVKDEALAVEVPQLEEALLQRYGRSWHFSKRPALDERRVMCALDHRTFQLARARQLEEDRRVRRAGGALAFEQQDRSDLEAFLTRHYSFI